MSVQASGGSKRLNHHTEFNAMLVDPNVNGTLGPEFGDQDQFLEIAPQAREGWEIYGIRVACSLLPTDAPGDVTEGRFLYSEVSERDEAVISHVDLAGGGNGGPNQGEDPESHQKSGTGVLTSTVGGMYCAEEASGGQSPATPVLNLQYEWEPENGTYLLENPAELNCHLYAVGRESDGSSNDLITATMTVAYDPYTLS